MPRATTEPVTGLDPQFSTDDAVPTRWAEGRERRGVQFSQTRWRFQET